MIRIGLGFKPDVKAFFSPFNAVSADFRGLRDGVDGALVKFGPQKGLVSHQASLAIDNDPLFIPNLSVWTDIPSLGAFVYRSGHVEIMRRRQEWFEPMDVYMALWWIPAGHTPTVEEALEKLAHLQAHGPTPAAFTFKVPFPAPSGEAVEPEWWIVKGKGHVGKGITLVPHKHAEEHIARRSAKKPALLQRYITNPLLLEGKKFGLRLWVFITGVEPTVRMYLSEKGLCIVSAKRYQQ